MIPSKEEMYAALEERHGKELQKLFSETAVVICGLGGLGSNVAVSLARAGIGRIHLIDFDKVDISNLNRQQYFPNQLGKYKADALTETLKKADVVFMCTFPKHIISFVEENAKYFKENCIVTDVCGIKSEICPALTEICTKNGLRFVGSHPMAGKEQFTYEASEAELFKGASYIIVPCSGGDEAVDTIKELALSIGFGMIRMTTPAEHDRMIAFTSQLPHVLACAYVKSPCCPDHVGFSAGSYKDVSRVASINENLWTDLFLNNKEPLSLELQILIDNLTEFNNAIKSDDNEKLREMLKEARLVKQGLGE